MAVVIGACFVHRAEKCRKADAKRMKLETKLIKLQKLNKLRDVESSDVVGAFVTFQHAESAYRCQSDYHYTFSTRCQPHPIRFEHKGKKYRLKVEEAPPPSDVIWENIEASKRQLCWRRTLTNGVLFVRALANGAGVVVPVVGNTHAVVCDVNG